MPYERLTPTHSRIEIGCFSMPVRSKSTPKYCHRKILKKKKNYPQVTTCGRVVPNHHHLASKQSPREPVGMVPTRSFGQDSSASPPLVGPTAKENLGRSGWGPRDVDGCSGSPNNVDAGVPSRRARCKVVENNASRDQHVSLEVVQSLPPFSIW